MVLLLGSCLNGFGLLVKMTAGGLGDWLRRHPRVQRAQAWVTASILAGLALGIALPENR